jgi:hypothetical protein
VYSYEVGDLPANSTPPLISFAVRYADTREIVTSELQTPFVINGQRGPSWDADQVNNEDVVTIGVPDLVIRSFTFEPVELEAEVPVTFTVVVQNQGTGPARNAAPTGGPFFLDIFTYPVPSYPWVAYSDIYTSVPELQPGAIFTATLRHPAGFSVEEVLQGIGAFYAKIDNHEDYPYGLVPEFDEDNNVRAVSTTPTLDIYLPMIQVRWTGTSSGISMNSRDDNGISPTTPAVPRADGMEYDGPGGDVPGPLLPPVTRPTPAPGTGSRRERR